MRFRLGPLAAAITVTAPVAVSLAQGTTPRENAGAHARALRQAGRVGPALRELRQERGPEPQVRLDSIADSLAVIAVSNEVSLHTRNLAIRTLTNSGIRGEDGVPYRGAESRLLRVALGSNSGAALWGLTELADQASARAAMRSIAVSKHPLAFGAVDLLAQKFGAEGLTVLRLLYNRQSVVNREAKELLERLAYHHKWK